MIHGTIPPAHLITRTQFDDPDLFVRASLPWDDPPHTATPRDAGEPSGDSTPNADPPTADADDQTEPDDDGVVDRTVDIPPPPSLRQLTGAVADRRSPDVAPATTPAPSNRR
jgi:hypothetical protein